MRAEAGWWGGAERWGEKKGTATRNTRRPEMTHRVVPRESRTRRGFKRVRCCLLARRRNLDSSAIGNEKDNDGTPLFPECRARVSGKCGNENAEWRENL